MRILVFDPSNCAPLYLDAYCGALEVSTEICIVAPNRVRRPGLGPKSNGIKQIRRAVLSYVMSARKGVLYLKSWILVLILARRYDVVHIQWITGLNRCSAEIVLLRVLMAINPNIAYTVHNILPHGMTDNPVVRRRYATVYRLMPLLFVHSEDTKRSLMRDFSQPCAKIVTIQHGPLFSEGGDAEPFSTPRYACAIIGNIYPYKGALDALDAVEILKRNGRDITLLLAGRFEPRYKREIRQRIQQLELEESIVIKDRELSDDEVRGLHRETSIVLAPYTDISQSGAVLTAIGMCVPVVCYDLGGLPETVEKNVNGIVVKSGDVEGLASAIETILSDYQKFRDGANQIRGKFSWDSAAHDTLSAYRRILGVFD